MKKVVCGDSTIIYIYIYMYCTIVHACMIIHVFKHED